MNMPTQEDRIRQLARYESSQKLNQLADEIRGFKTALRLLRDAEEHYRLGTTGPSQDLLQQAIDKREGEAKYHQDRITRNAPRGGA